MQDHLHSLAGPDGIDMSHSSFDTGQIHLLGSDITPEPVYRSRREIIKGLAAGSAGLALAGWTQREALAQTPGATALPGKPSAVSGAVTMDKPTSYKDATSYNNFYEFGTDKTDPARYAHTLQTQPWSVAIEGLVKKPGNYGLEDLSLIHI